MYNANVLKSLRGDFPQTNLHEAKVFTVQLTSVFFQLFSTLFQMEFFLTLSFSSAPHPSEQSYKG